MSCPYFLPRVFQSLRISSQYQQYATPFQSQRRWASAKAKTPKPTKRAASGGSANHFMKSNSRAPFYGKDTGARLTDRRITLLRYHLNHPTKLTPRPLRFSRNRFLRHWTIHRAWQLHTHNRRKAQQLSLERQFNSMKQACEELYTLGENGVRGPDGEIAEQIQCVDADGEVLNMGKVYRRAMEKKGVWGEVPREYAGRLVTDWPSRNGWDTDWRR